MSFAQELRRRLRCSDPLLDGVIVNPKNESYTNSHEVTGEPFDLALFNNMGVRSVRLPKAKHMSGSSESFIVRALGMHNAPTQKCN
jgi:hypothetical protein